MNVLKKLFNQEENVIFYVSCVNLVTKTSIVFANKIPRLKIRIKLTSCVFAIQDIF